METAAWLLLCLLVFTLPWEKSVWVAGIGTISRLLGALAVTAGAAAAMRRGSLRFPNAALLTAAVFVIWTGLTYTWSLAPPATAARFLTFSQLLVMVWLIWEFCRDEARQTQLMQAYVAGAVVSSVYTLARFALNQQTYYRRYAAAGFDPNDLGLTLALSIPLALYLAMRSRGAEQWLYRLAIVLSLAAVLLTASRSALIATLIGFSFVLLSWRQSSRVDRISSMVLIGLLLLGVVRLAPSSSRERLATLRTELIHGTLHSRTRIWKTGLKVLKQHPAAGVGSGAYPAAVRPWLGVPKLAGHEYVAHNTFLSVLVETGVIGFAIFGLMLACLALFVWMMPAAERALWAVMLAVWTIGVSTLTWEHRKLSWLIFALIMTQWALSFRPAEKRP